MLDLKARPMLERDFEPLFKLEHMLKDVRHCLAEARALGVELRLAEVAERLYAEAAEDGPGSGTSPPSPRPPAERTEVALGFRNLKPRRLS